MTDSPRVLILTCAQTGCELWRCHWPAAALRAQGQVVHVRPTTAADVPALARQVDVVVLARVGWLPPHYAAGVQWLQEFRRLGLPILYEVDDDIFTDAIDAHAAVMRPSATRAQHREERLARRKALALCDGVTVSTTALAARVEQVTDRPPVAVVPNLIPWRRWRAACRQGAGYGPGLTIGWAGGKRQDADFEAMAAAWGRIAARYPEVRFVTIGYCSPLLQAAVPAERLVAVPWQPVDQYERAYRGLDIGCAPLAATPFNQTKSCCKLLEYAAAGAAVVASPTVYGPSLRPGIDGLIAASAAAWEAALALLIEDADRRQRIAATWATRVQQRHALEAGLWQWPRAWSKLVRQARGRTRGVA